MGCCTGIANITVVMPTVDVTICSKMMWLVFFTYAFCFSAYDFVDMFTYDSCALARRQLILLINHGYEII